MQRSEPSEIPTVVYATRFVSQIFNLRMLHISCARRNRGFKYTGKHFLVRMTAIYVFPGLLYIYSGGTEF